MNTINMAEHNGWGDSIYWLDYKRRKITGHLTPKPKIGDKIICEMKSTNKYRNFKICTVARVKDFDDPPDQFFATVNDSGYIIETETKGFKFELGSRCPICKKKLKRNFMTIDRHIGKKHKELISVV